jgi:hypothetical protein
MTSDNEVCDTKYNADKTEYNEPFYPHYQGFKFYSKKAQYKYLRSLWPHHQHKILTYLYFKNIMEYEPYVTINEIADELKIHKARSSADLKKIFRRQHLKKYKEYRPYRYYFTDQGLIYASHIWLHFYDYHLNLMGYFKTIYKLPDIPIIWDGTEKEIEDSKYQHENRKFEKNFAWEGILMHLRLDYHYTN